MKRIMQRSYSVLIVTLAFFIGICFVGYKVVADSGSWVQDPMNLYLFSTEQRGKILDRNGKTLAYTNDEGSRRYDDDESVRRSLLHVVGDNSTNISTAIQSMFRADLSGYNLFAGMGMPDSLQSQDIHLTVDADACRAAYEAMDGCNGACIVYNYKTGEVLVSVSNPTYDPADPPEITEENKGEYDGVYLDNVLSSTYIPGSTFKIITAAAAIENIPDIDQRTFTCTGSFRVPGTDWDVKCEGEVHGELSFRDAIAHSCNCAVAQIALELGAEKMAKTAEKFGYNDDSFTMSGIPLAESRYVDYDTGVIELAMSAIGQHHDLANPAHMAMIAGAIANGGTAVSPYIVEEDGSLLGRLGMRSKKGDNVRMISSDTAGKLKAIMHNAFDHYYITIAGMDNVCAKTGTAEIDADNGDNGKTNAWFFGFIDDERYPYAFAVVRVVDKWQDSYGINSASVIDSAISALIYK